MSRIYISAAHKSSGKTMLTIGLCRCLVDDGIVVQPFKKGPDYIDPLWLGRASRRACYNVDFFTTPRDEILASFEQQSSGAGLALIEGNKGLYDGMDLYGSDSNAAMANLLDAPVVLVINCNGITRGIAPLLQGYVDFDGAPRFAGVILNNVAGPRHEQKLREAVQNYTDLALIGAVRRSSNMVIDERHLGLIPGNEQQDSENAITRISAQVREQVDLDFFRSRAEPVFPSDVSQAVSKPLLAETQQPLRVGIFMDEAFGFYYADDLRTFADLGVELVPVNALQDNHLPEVDALFIGGGFPETHVEELSANRQLMHAVRDFIEQDGVVYAECGGLMYLCDDLTWQDKHAKMCGVIPARVVMSEKPQGRGYIRLAETDNMPWPGREDTGSAEIAAHEFHYSRLEGLPDMARFAYRVLRGTGINGEYDGYLYRNLLANYAHMRDVGNNRWVERFTGFIRARKSNRGLPDV